MKKRTVWLIIPMLCILNFPLPGRTAEPPDSGSAVASAAPPAVDWSAIATLDLDTAITIALSGNPSLKAAMARVQQAKDLVDQARSTYWPQLDAAASGSRVKLSENAYQENLATARFFNPSTTSITDPEDYYNASLTAAWTLFDGFARKFRNVAARYGEASSAEALKDTRRLLISAVASAYFSAQLAIENIAIARADEAFNKRQLTDAEARQRVGTGALSDVLNFKVRENQAKTVRINQEYRYEIALYGLAALLGIPQSHMPGHVRLAPLLPESSGELAIPQVEGLIAEAMDMRPDIQQTRFLIKQSDAQIDVARSGYYPSVVLSGSLDGQRTANARFGEDDFGNTIQVGVTYNLFSGGYTRAKVREASHRRIELEKQLEDLTLSTTANIRSAATLVETAQAQVVLQRDNLKLVRRTRDLVEKEYNAGQASLVRLNEAQRDLTAAQSNLALALVSLRQAWMELKTRTGSILATYGAS